MTQTTTHKVTLEKMVHGGKALARLDDGRVALVAGGIPGETVVAELASRSGVLQGEVREVLEPHPERREPSPHPGLDYSFINDPHQLTVKQQVVRDALLRSLNRDVRVPQLVSAQQPWHYRNTVQPAAQQGRLGYRKPDSHDLVVLEADPVAQAPINRAWEVWQTHADDPRRVKGVREVVFRCNDDGDVLLCLIASASARNYLDLGHALVRDGITGVSYAPYDARGRFRGGFERLAGTRTVQQRYGRFEISLSATSFAQPNPKAAGMLYGELEAIAGEGKRVVDLFAGSGVVGFHLANAFDEVVALEIDKSSVRRGQQDAERLDLGNIKFRRADARKTDLPDADLVCVDPPRAGLAKALREKLIYSPLKQLLYVSCDVATWARDVAHFESEGFRLVHLQPYDFYPQTHHIEMLSLLKR